MDNTSASQRPLLLRGGTVLTMDPTRPRADAVGIRNGRISVVGSVREVEQALGRGADVQEIRGALLPGFIDPHHHFSLVVSDPHTLELALPAGSSVRDLLPILQRIAAEHPGTGWVRAHGFDPLGLRELRGPLAAELDSICSDRPLLALSYSFHDASLNSRGLAELGWDASTPDPPGGRLVRGRRGRPSGELVETAAFIAEARSRDALVAAAGDDAWLDRCERHARLLLSHGITRVGDAAVPPAIARLYERAAAEGRLPLAVHRMPVGADQFAQPHFPLLPSGAGPAASPVGPAKLIVDGGERCAVSLTRGQAIRVAAQLVGKSLASFSLAPMRGSSRGSGMRRGADGNFHGGIRVLGDAALESATREAAERDFQVAVHAVGNEAVASALDALARVDGRLRRLPGRPRIEHALLVDPPLIRRIADSGVMVVTQPSFLYAFGDRLRALPTPAPLAILPLRSMWAAGIDLALSSDYPAASCSVLAGLRAAATRQTRGQEFLDEREAVSVEQALHGYTLGAARALGVDGQAGSISPGKRADLVILSDDPLSVLPEYLTNLHVSATYVGGTLAYAAQA